MGWNALGSHGNPLTPQVVISISRKFEFPKRCVDTHAHLMRQLVQAFHLQVEGV